MSVWSDDGAALIERPHIPIGNMQHVRPGLVYLDVPAQPGTNRTGLGTPQPRGDSHLGQQRETAASPPMTSITKEPVGSLMTIKEAAAILGISRTTAYSWAHTGRLPVVHHGERGVRVPRGALDQYVDDLEQRALASVK